MSELTRGRTKHKLYAVTVNDYLAHAWKGFELTDGSHISTADLEALQILDITTITTSIAKCISIGANYPKPATFTKQRGEPGSAKLNTLTTFGSHDANPGILTTQGWTRTAYGLSLPSGDTLRNSWVCVDLGGNNGFYAWSMPQANFNIFAADLGIQKVSSLSDINKQKAFAGARLPFPVILQKLSGTKAEGRGSEVFCSTSKVSDAIASGNWKIKSFGRTFLGAEIRG